MIQLTKLALSLLFIPMSLLLLCLISLRFILLNSSFLINSLNNSKVYEAVASQTQKALNTNIEEHYLEESIMLNNEDVKKILRDKKDSQKILVEKLVTKEFVKDIAEQNIERIVSFLNGAKDIPNLYLPIQQFLPVNNSPNGVIFSNNTDFKRFIESLYNETSTQVYSQISLLGKTGFILNMLILLLVVTQGLILLFFYRAEGVNVGWQNVGLILLTTGITLIMATKLVTITTMNLANDLMESQEPIIILTILIIKPLLTNIFNMWWLGSAIILTIALFIFIKGIKIKVLNPHHSF